MLIVCRETSNRDEHSKYGGGGRFLQTIVSKHDKHDGPFYNRAPPGFMFLFSLHGLLDYEIGEVEIRVDTRTDYPQGISFPLTRGQDGGDGIWKR